MTEWNTEKHISQLYWLVVSTHLKNISQNGNLPQIGVNMKNIWNHHLVYNGDLLVWGPVVWIPGIAENDCGIVT